MKFCNKVIKGNLLERERERIYIIRNVLFNDFF